MRDRNVAQNPDLSSTSRLAVPRSNDRGYAAGTVVVLAVSALQMACVDEELRTEQLALSASTPIVIVRTDSTPCATEVRSGVSDERWQVGCAPVSMATKDSTCSRIGAYSVAVWFDNRTALCAYHVERELLWHRDGSLVRRSTVTPEWGALLHYFPCLATGVSIRAKRNGGGFEYLLWRTRASPVGISALEAGSLKPAKSSTAGSDTLISPARLVIAMADERTLSVSTSRDTLVVNVTAERCGSDAVRVDTARVSSAYQQAFRETRSRVTLAHARFVAGTGLIVVLSAGRLLPFVCDRSVQCEPLEKRKARGRVIAAFECLDGFCELYKNGSGTVGVARHKLILRSGDAP